MAKPQLTLFDLDGTLISTDTNQAWIAFLIEQKLVDADQYRAGSAAMEERYRTGASEIDYVFCEFFLGTLDLVGTDRLTELLPQFVERFIRPAIAPGARALIESERSEGKVLAIITATNRVITEPIAKLFGIEHLIATEAQVLNGRFTGKVAGVPSMRSGKVKRLQAWLAQGAISGVSRKEDLAAMTFYSDSINDLPLLLFATRAVAVDPDPGLVAAALARAWSIISLRDAREVGAGLPD